MMKNRFGKLILTLVVDNEEEVAYCDRKDEMCREMEVRKRAREETLEGLAYEGGPNRASMFTGSRCPGGYQSWGVRSRCCVCGTESKLYRLYKTTRSWEAEYDARDQC